MNKQRVLAGVIVGTISAIVMVTTFEWVGHLIFPPPAGVNLLNDNMMRAYIRQLSVGAFVLLLAGWMVAAGVGAALAGRIGRTTETRPGLIVGGIVLAGCIFNFVSIPHPLWFVAASLVAVSAATWVGARAGARG